MATAKRDTGRNARIATKAIAAYLKATGWNKFQLADVCGIHHTALSHLFALRRAPSLRLVIALVDGTKAARKATGVPPLTLADLAPHFETLLASAAA